MEILIFTINVLFNIYNILILIPVNIYKYVFEFFLKKREIMNNFTKM